MKKLFLVFTLLFVFIGFSPAQEKNFYDYYNDAVTASVAMNEKVEQLISKVDEITALNTEQNEEIISLKESVRASVADLSDANEQIIRQNEQIKVKNKWLIIVCSILGLFFIAHIVIFIIGLKWNIKLPYWLNALI